MSARTAIAPSASSHRRPGRRCLAVACLLAGLAAVQGCQSSPLVAQILRGHGEMPVLARASAEESEGRTQWAESRVAQPPAGPAVQTMSWRPAQKEKVVIVEQGPAIGGFAGGQEKVQPPDAKGEPKGEPLPAPRPLVTDPGLAVIVGPPVPKVPNELRKVSLPPYTVAPPDILLIESTRGLPTQPVRGQHLVRPDGTLNLGIYGTVYVAGMNLDQVRFVVARAIESRLDPEAVKMNPVKSEDVNVDVLAYNSKVYYVITDGGGYGEQVYSFPIVGNETVLDAMAKINGLPPVASKKHIWVARRTPGHGHNNILPVDWCGITQRGEVNTNYQLFPGDRIYVQADKLITADSWLAKILAPVERVLGVTLLGSTTVNSIRNRNNNVSNP